MSKLIVPFDTYKVNTALDPEGGYAMRLGEQQIVEDVSVYEEVIKEKTLPLSPELLQFATSAVLNTMAAKTAADCRPRKIGGLIKCAAYTRGKLPGPYSAFDTDTCSAAVIFSSLKGVAKKVDLSKVQFVNSRTGLKVVIDRITYEGSTSEVGVIMKTKAIVVTGLNLQFISTGDNPDSITLSWKDAGGTEHTASVTPSSSTVTEMKIPFPDALADVAEGTEITFRFLTRGGIEDADPQPNNKTVTLLAAV